VGDALWSWSNGAVTLPPLPPFLLPAFPHRPRSGHGPWTDGDRGNRNGSMPPGARTESAREAAAAACSASVHASMFITKSAS
jgi:hypothetical protein